MRTASRRSPRAPARTAQALPPASGPGSWRRPLVRMDRGRALIEQLGGRRAIFRRPRLLLVVAARRRGFRLVGADGLYVARELPDLLGGHLVAKRRHSMRT